MKLSSLYIKFKISTINNKFLNYTDINCHSPPLIIQNRFINNDSNDSISYNTNVNDNITNIGKELFARNEIN